MSKAITPLPVGCNVVYMDFTDVIKLGLIL
jgi:hypothetical protein